MKRFLPILYLFLGLAFGALISQALAWVDPTAAPPAGNAPAPINVSSTTQTKTGGLNILGDVVIGDPAASSQRNLLFLQGPADALGLFFFAPGADTAAPGIPSIRIIGGVWGAFVPSAMLGLGSVGPGGGVTDLIHLNNWNTTASGADTAILFTTASSIADMSAGGRKIARLVGVYESGSGSTITGGFLFQTANSGALANRMQIYGDGRVNIDDTLIVGSTASGYLQFRRTSAGPPTATDCDEDAERGRLVIDTTNNRLYVCNGATRGWDYVALTD